MILDDFKSHLVPEEYQREPPHVHWACVKGYLTWFYRVSHPILTPDSLEEPSRPANLEVLEVQDEQAKSMTMVCQRVAYMGITAIKSGLFEDDST